MSTKHCYYGNESHIIHDDGDNKTQTCNNNSNNEAQTNILQDLKNILCGLNNKVGGLDKQVSGIGDQLGLKVN